MPIKKRPGPKPKKKSDLCSQTVNVRATRTQVSSWKKMCKKERYSISEMVRTLMDKEFIRWKGKNK